MARARRAPATERSVADAQATSFAMRLLAWHDQHGRHDLPWQHPRTPYRVWVAEVMLQQTQIATVIGYFERFLAAFPTLPELAAADLDAVLALWSGLGYYARARNLHRAARICMAEHSGELPVDPELLAALPGIGRTTAAAIAAQAYGARVPILDANVRRVLARHAGIDGEPTQRATVARLWVQSETRLPHVRLADYTQAIMDLGATCCKPRQPDCQRCPVAGDCVALATGRVAELPRRGRSRRVPLRRAILVIAQDRQGRLLLERRAPAGVWGGLWSLPEAGNARAARNLLDRYARADWRACRRLPSFTHAFTHFRLAVTPLVVAARPRDEGVAAERLRWLTASQALALGLPQPVRQLIARLDSLAPVPEIAR